MSMLRMLAPGGGKGKLHPPPRGSTPVPTPSSDGKPVLRLVIPNYGVLWLPAPETPQQDGSQSNEPRDDPMIHGVLEITLPAGSGSKRCKAIRVGLKTVITLDLGQGRRYEEDILFERKVEIISSNADGLALEEGTQQQVQRVVQFLTIRFNFTIIIPANLASHDWHTNGVISHVLYAEVEGLPDPNAWSMGRVMSSSSLFGLRRPSSRPGSRSGSRGASPTTSPPLSPRMSRAPSITTFGASPPLSSSVRRPASPSAHASGSSIDTTLANLNGNQGTPTLIDVRRTSSTSSLGGSPLPSPTSSPIPIPMGGGTAVNPAFISAAQSLSITRQEAPMLPSAPSYDESIKDGAGLGEQNSSEWLIGVHKGKRNVMVVYNPDPDGGATSFSERINGYVPGLGMWNVQMVSDVWSIGTLLSFKLEIASLSSATTVFAIKLFLNQTHSIISPRDVGGEAKHGSTRRFAIIEEGVMPPTGYNNPDKRYAALWRGKEAGGDKDAIVNDTFVIDKTARLPNDKSCRPSTLPGVITPITVTHTLSLEVAFSVWGEDDLGKKMDRPTWGGLRMLRVTRPVLVPSCCLVPGVLELPSYAAHDKDPVAPPPEQMPTGLPGWEFCACGWKIEELEARMRQSVVAQQAEADNAAERAARANGTAAPLPSGTGPIMSGMTVSGNSRISEEERNKIWGERGGRG